MSDSERLSHLYGYIRGRLASSQVLKSGQSSYVRQGEIAAYEDVLRIIKELLDSNA